MSNQHFQDNDTDDNVLDDSRPLTPEEQRERLRRLIMLGKERGYITYAEINDSPARRYVRCRTKLTALSI